MQTFTSEQYILIAIANHYGYDKWNWEQRINWVKDYINTLLSEGVTSNIIEAITTMEKELVEDAKEPMLFRKACQAYRDYCQGNKSGYVMLLDGTASGIQILSTLIGCKNSAFNTNLLGGDRKCVYQMAATYMAKELGTEVSRDDIKKPLMTTFYGSKAQPIALFGEDTPELQAFYNMLENELGGAIEAMNDIQSCWNPTVIAHQWTLPDGHTAYVPVMVAEDKKIEIDELEHRSFTHRAYINEPSQSGVSLAANVVHSIDGFIVREMYRRCGAKRMRHYSKLAGVLEHQGIEPNDLLFPTQFLSVVDIDAMTADDLISMDYSMKAFLLSRLNRLIGSGFDIVTIHDCFGCRPKHMNMLRRHYINILAELAASNILSDILTEVTGQEIEVIKRNNDLAILIATQAEYALS